MASFLLLALIWGTSFYIAKSLMLVSNTYTAVFLRLLWAYIPLFFLFIFKVKSQSLDIINILRAMLLGLLTNGIPFYFLFKGLETVPSGFAALFTGLVPSGVIVIMFLRRKKLSFKFSFLAITLSLIGLYFMHGETLNQTTISSSKEVWVGFSYLALMVFFYAFSNAFMDRLYPPLNNIPNLHWQFLASSVFLFAQLNQEQRMAISQVLFHPSAIVLGALNTAFAMFLYFHIIKTKGNLFASQVTLVFPAVAVAISLFMGETSFSLNYLYAIIAILLSIKMGKLALR